MAGTLYLIPNTLGPSEGERPLDTLLPPEVCRIVGGLSHFIAENPKSARAFLKLSATVTPLARPLQEIVIAELNVNTRAADLPDLLAPIHAGNDAGLISEAGVPAVADPGADLVRLAHETGIRVRPLVGPSSLLLAVMASGLNGQSFAFHGYLPVDAQQRTKRIRALEERSRTEKQTQLFIETPYRNGAMLEALATTCRPDTLICVATGLTLPDESILTRKASAWKNAIQQGRMPDFNKKPTVFLFLTS